MKKYEQTGLQGYSMKPQLQRDVALVVYAAQIKGMAGMQAELRRIILDRDMTLTQATRLVEEADKALFALCKSTS